MMQRLHAECFENLDTLRSYFSLWAAEVFVTGDSESELASLACTEAESVEQTNSNNVAAAAAPGVAPLRAPRGRRRRRSTAAASAASSSSAPYGFTYGVWHCATPGCTESGYGLRPAAESPAQQKLCLCGNCACHVQGLEVAEDCDRDHALQLFVALRISSITQ